MSIFALLLVATSTGLHASWNLLAHSRRHDPTFFLRSALLTGLVGIGPVLWAEAAGKAPFPSAVWALLAVTGLFQGLYFLGLTRGYEHGEFTVVYPVARALPVLVLALVDVARQRMPSPLGWLGILLVGAGCLILPLDSLRHVHWNRYLNRTGFWILITAVGGIGYSTIDKIAAEMLAPGAATAARYGLAEALFTVPYLWLLLRLTGSAGDPSHVQSPADWRTSTLAAVAIFSAYWLILWTYQISPYASYVVALRQLSIVIGVVAAALLFREKARGLRIGAATVIALGAICVALA